MAITTATATAAATTRSVIAQGLRTICPTPLRALHQSYLVHAQISHNPREPANAPLCSLMMIADVGAHLAAEHPIRPRRVGQDDRQQEQRADQEELLRARRGRGLVEREMSRHDHGPQADGDADVRHYEQS